MAGIPIAVLLVLSLALWTYACWESYQRTMANADRNLWRTRCEYAQSKISSLETIVNEQAATLAKIHAAINGEATGAG